ncbi:MAG: acetyl-CoA synthase subunit gamma, partial [bacterium]|nr:acetyl-CoA synthase subunit gamma [bacterium]
MASNKPKELNAVKDENAPSCCCGGETDNATSSVKKETDFYKPNVIRTAIGDVPIVSTKLTNRDKLGRWKMRWRTKRNEFTVEPGLYAVGNPDENSPVTVSANYKMSFDHLRSQLSGIDAWIIVLDTKGINVWCAAGKGTFGTDELVNRIKTTGIGEIVSHRNLIVPQLGAPGISAHRVKQKSGFKVIYGPVRAEDIKNFLDAGMEATKEMRRVEFPLKDRVILGPVELVGGIKYIFI